MTDDSATCLPPPPSDDTCDISNCYSWHDSSNVTIATTAACVTTTTTTAPDSEPVSVSATNADMSQNFFEYQQPKAINWTGTENPLLVHDVTSGLSQNKHVGLAATSSCQYSPTNIFDSKKLPSMFEEQAKFAPQFQPQPQHLWSQTTSLDGGYDGRIQSQCVANVLFEYPEHVKQFDTTTAVVSPSANNNNNNRYSDNTICNNGSLPCKNNKNMAGDSQGKSGYQINKYSLVAQNQYQPTNDFYAATVGCHGWQIFDSRYCSGLQDYGTTAGYAAPAGLYDCPFVLGTKVAAEVWHSCNHGTKMAAAAELAVNITAQHHHGYRNKMATEMYSFATDHSTPYGNKMVAEMLGVADYGYAQSAKIYTGDPISFAVERLKFEGKSPDSTMYRARCDIMSPTVNSTVGRLTHKRYLQLVVIVPKKMNQFCILVYIIF